MICCCLSYCFRCAGGGKRGSAILECMDRRWRRRYARECPVFSKCDGEKVTVSED